MTKIVFKGNPPMMDFTLVKLTGGQNLIDNQSRGIYSLGEGELTKIINDAGQALRRSLEATLKNMGPNQMIRVQILMHGNVGYTFLPPNSYGDPSFAEKVKFTLTGDDDTNGNVIVARGKADGNFNPFNNANLVKDFVVIVDNDGNDSIIETDSAARIKHAKAGDNEDRDGEIITAN